MPATVKVDPDQVVVDGRVVDLEQGQAVEEHRLPEELVGVRQDAGSCPEVCVAVSLNVPEVWPEASLLGKENSIQVAPKEMLQFTRDPVVGNQEAIVVGRQGKLTPWRHEELTPSR
jgi:hypothetical protein